MLHKIFTWIDYGLYLLKSNSLHGTHSPFIYQWAEQVLYSQKKFPNHHVELARSWALKSSKTVAGTPYTVKQWALMREPNAKYGQLLQRHLDRFQPHRIIHYGVGLGILPAYALEMPIDQQAQVHVYLEHEAWLPFLEKTMQQVGSASDSWVIHSQLYDRFEWKQEDLVLVDALWLVEQNRQQWFQWWDNLSNPAHSVWIYNVQASEKTRNWTRWMQHQGPYNISVDLFWTMCLFSRPEQSSEPFILRY